MSGIWLYNRSYASPCGTIARSLNLFPPASTITSGCVTRLWNQDGFVGAPPFDAMTTRRSPFRVYAGGFSRVSPELARLVVRINRWPPVKGANVALPLLARRSLISAWLKSWKEMLIRRFIPMTWAKPFQGNIVGL